MRTLLVLCTAVAASLLGACVSFDPSGQPMNDDVVDPAADVDAGVATPTPDAAAMPPPVDAAPVDAAPVDDDPDDPPDPPDDDDNSGPGGGGGGPGGGGGGGPGGGGGGD